MERKLALENIGTARLANQHIAGTKFKTAKEIVSWMGAMQAQDFNMAKWALGIRLPGTTEKEITEAFDKGDIIRTHLLRPTWHMVAAEDIHWMLALTAPNIKAKAKTGNKTLGLTDAIIKKSNSLIEKALIKDRHLNRKQLMDILEKAKIPTHDARSSYLMLAAELDSIICNGPGDTYALLHERVPDVISLDRDEALARLANTYFTSHAPATLQDFIWWSGLSVSDSKRAVDIIRKDFIAEEIAGESYLLQASFSIPGKEEKSLYLLPAFDEYVISYKSRSIILNKENHRKAVSVNGIFWPLVILDGKVIGTWSRAKKKDHTLVGTQFFKKPTGIKNMVKAAAKEYGKYLDRKIAVEI